MTKPLATITGLVLLALAAVHALWIMLAWNVTVGGASLPVWVPMVGFVLTLIAGIGLLVESHRETREDRGGAPKPGETREAVRRPAAKFTVHQGRRYKAQISLGFFEQMASNDMIVAKLEEVGFKEVKVTGSGGSREAEARWTGPDTSAEFPSQVVSAVELPEPAQVASTTTAPAAPAAPAVIQASAIQPAPAASPPKPSA